MNARLLLTSALVAGNGLALAYFVRRDTVTTKPPRPKAKQETKFEAPPLRKEPSFQVLSDPYDKFVFEHREVLNGFLSVEGKFGISRVEVMIKQNPYLATHVGTTAFPRSWNAYPPDSAGIRYQLSEWGLLGRVEESAPQVYFIREPIVAAHEGVDGQGTSEGQEVLVKRDADEVERKAISMLQENPGSELVKFEEGTQVRTIGAIRAAEFCLRCHSEAKVGDALGAFTYTYSKTPLSGPQLPRMQLARETRSEWPSQSVARPFGWEKEAAISRQAGFASAVRSWEGPEIVTHQALQLQLLRYEVVLSQLENQLRNKPVSPRR